jgi:hypothetical protein
MPLTLLSSVSFNTDIPYVIPVDIVTTKSLVIDVVNLTELTRRMAGWVYSSVDSGLGDSEFADGQLLLFGKNRVVFGAHPNPFRLKFYPMYGLKNFDFNIYSGDNIVAPGTQLNASFVGRLDRGIRGGVIQYRMTAGSTWQTVPGMAGVAQAYYRPSTNALLVRTHHGEISFCIVGTWTWTFDTPATLRVVVAETATRALHQIETPQF